MDIQPILRPLAQDVIAIADDDEHPEITHIQYDLWVLRITLAFPRVDPPVYLSVEGVRGFRVLAKGDLLEFWTPDTARAWLFQVDRGGWMDLERTRGGFLSGLNDNYAEYLIAGIDACVSVLAADEPKVFVPAP